MSIEAMKLAQDLRALADRFSEGWHDGIKIDASDIMLLSTAAEAIEQAQKSNEIDVLKIAMDSINHHAKELWKCRARIQQLEQAQKQANERSEVEPVAWYHPEDYKTHFTTGPSKDMVDNGYWQPLYTSPQQQKQEPVAWLTEERYAQIHTPQRQWVGLTDKEIFNMGLSNYVQVIREAEAKLKEKNHG